MAFGWRRAFFAFVLLVQGRGVAGFSYCGGGDQTDGAAQLSCTAYPAYVEPVDAGSECQSDDMFNLAYNGNTGREALVWQANGAPDYWVIHGCDGAGMMNDVQDGSSFYLEWFQGLWGWEEPHDCSGYSPGDCQSPWDMDACWCQHWESPFVHPGTSQSYHTWAGMWTTCGAQWPDALAKKPWWDTLVAAGLMPTEDYGCDPGSAATAFVIMYPWVCNGPWSGADYSAWWGDDGNWQNGLPFGDDTYRVNCYYDNEPFDLANANPGVYDPHFDSPMPPPQFQIYKFVKANPEDGYITGWMVAKKDHDGDFENTLGGEGFVLWAKTDGPPF